MLGLDRGRRVKGRAGQLSVGILTVLALALAVPAMAGNGYLTPAAPLVALDPGVPNGARVIPIINSGDSLGGFTFEGIPDGIGLAPGPDKKSVDVYVAHEQSTVPFRGAADHQDASISRLTLSTKTPNLGAVLDASVVLGPEDGYIRFCSAFMATPADGFDSYVFFTGEESNDVVPVPVDAPYGADPAVAPARQAGYVVAHDTATGESVNIPGMGRLNHENTVVVGGNWDGVAMVTTDDTFTAGTSQLYLYVADDGDGILADEGTLYAFRVTADESGPVDPTDPFNGANDYLDLDPGQSFRGEFIPVPEDVAKGLTGEPPQEALENWSNDNNIFQFVRLEDAAADKGDSSVVYVADTGASRVVPDPGTGRMARPSGAVGQADNGSIFKFAFDPNDPTSVVEFSVVAQGDDPNGVTYVPFVAPDNLDTSAKSIMVQEDADNARVWQYRFNDGWRVVAHVTDPDGESSGIVDASRFFGPGWWLLDVQAHGSNQMEEQVGEVLIKREDGQLLLMKIPGS